MRTLKYLLPLFLAVPLQGQSAPATGEVTFNKQIAPIIYKNCSPCHRPGEAAPFSVLSYKDAFKKAHTIAKVTASHQMPPWKPEPGSYLYRDDRRLSDADTALIQAWVEQGAPEGNPADKIDPPQFRSGWALGEPDLIVEMPAAFHVPAEGADIYRNIPVALGLTEDKWVTAVVMRPSARTVVHHVLYFADPTGKAHDQPWQGTEPGFSGMRAGSGTIPLGGWAVGGQPHLMPQGLALKLPKGSDLIVQYHFHETGKPEEEKSQIGFYFAKEPPKRSLARIQMPIDYSLFSGLDIPAGEKDFVIRDSYTLPIAIEGVEVSVHAHYIGKNMRMTATLPNGDVKTLLLISDWDFAWQDHYFFKDLVPLPKGTRLDSEIHWDNSAQNERNPSNPPIHVRWGEESKDEMGSISLIVTPQDESEIRILRTDLSTRQSEYRQARLRADPALARRLRELFAQ